MSTVSAPKPGYSYPTDYKESVNIPMPTDSEIGFIRSVEVKTFGHGLYDGRMMAGMGDLYLPTAALATAVFHANDINKKYRSFIVLRTAKLLNCPYPWNINVRLSENAGASPDEIEALSIDGPVTGLDEEGNLLMRGVDEITLTGTLTDQTLSGIRARYSDEICRKYVLIFSWFNLFTRYCNGCRLPAESQEMVADQIKDHVNPM